MLIAALERAIAHGEEIQLYAGGEFYGGIPIELTHDFLRLICTNDKNDPPLSACWIIRLTAIETVSTHVDRWDENRLNRVINPDAVTIDRDGSDDDSGDELLTGV